MVTICISGHPKGDRTKSSCAERAASDVSHRYIVGCGGSSAHWKDHVSGASPIDRDR